MKKVLAFFTGLLLFVFAITPFVVAQEAQSLPGSVGQTEPADERIQIFPPPPTDSGSALFGQNHNYSVTFRGNGEATVLLRAIFTNQAESPMQNFVLQVPRVSPQDLLVYQVLKDPVCVRYRPQYVEQGTTIEKGEFVRDPSCLEYRDPNYDDFLYGGDAKFRKAAASVSGDRIEITLPSSVAAEKAGGLLVYYRATGYTSRDLFGRRDYTFETSKVPASIANLQVGISVDSDQVLKGGQGQVEYRFAEAATALKSAPDGAGADSVLNRYYSQIGYGQILKTASNIQPNESYTVKGSFATSILQLYAREILMVKLGIIAVLIVMFVVLRAFLRKLNAGSTSKTRTVPAALIVGVAMGSFVTSLVVIGFTIGLYLLASSIAATGAGAPVYPLILVFVAIVAVVGYAVMIIVPSIVIGIKKGVWWGVGFFIATKLWLGLYVAVFIMMVLLTRQPSYDYPVMPMMRQGAVEDRVVETPEAQ